MARVYQRATAGRDLVEHFVHLASARATFENLAELPRIGTPLHLSNPALENMRKWRISGFENYLVFYLPRADGVSVVRILHAARDWRSLFGVQADSPALRARLRVLHARQQQAPGRRMNPANRKRHFQFARMAPCPAGSGG
jgi:toxin ParE1/3/4